VLIVPYPWPFFVVIAANFAFFFGFQMTLVPFPLFVRSIGGSAADIGLLMGAMAVAAILSRPLAGRLADVRGRRIGLLIGGSAFGLGFALYPLVHSVLSLIPLRILQGVGISLFTTSYIAYVSDIAPPERRGEAMGLAGLAAPTSLLVGPLLGSRIAGDANFASLFRTSAAVVALAPLLALTIPETLRSRAGGTVVIGFRDILRRFRIVRPILATITVATTYGAVIAFLPVFVRERKVGDGGLFFTAFAITILTTQVAAGRLSDIVGRRMVAVPALTVLGMAMLLLASVSSQAALLLAAVAYGVGYGATRSSVEALIVDRVEREARGTAMGLNYAGFDTGVGLGSFALGFVADAWGYGTMYASLTVLCGAMAAAFAVKRR